MCVGLRKHYVQMHKWKNKDPQCSRNAISFVCYRHCASNRTRNSVLQVKQSYLQGFYLCLRLCAWLLVTICLAAVSDVDVLITFSWQFMPPRVFGLKLIC